MIRTFTRYVFLFWSELARWLCSQRLLSVLANEHIVEVVLDNLPVHKIPTRFALDSELPVLTCIASGSVSKIKVLNCFRFSCWLLFLLPSITILKINCLYSLCTLQCKHISWDKKESMGDRLQWNVMVIMDRYLLCQATPASLPRLQRTEACTHRCFIWFIPRKFLVSLKNCYVCGYWWRKTLTIEIV